MKRITHALIALCSAATAAQLANAKDDGGVTPLQAAPSALRADSAYILVRTSTAKSGMFAIQPVMLRIPSEQEMSAYRVAKNAAYQAALPDLKKAAKDGKILTLDEYFFDYKGPPNTFVVEHKYFLEDGPMRTMLLQVPPGTYLPYGITIGGRGMVTCNCLGTVSFSAKAGVITDVGSLYADKVHKASPVPHLEDNLGPQMFQYGFIFGEALVPADAATPVPSALRALSIERAQFRAVGRYYGSGGANINRLAPIPGILSYDERGRPVDVQSGKIAQ
jgi:hypothetical protein